MGTQFKTGSYKEIANWVPVNGTQAAPRSKDGRGPLDVYLLNSASFVLSASDGTTDVEVRTISGTTFQNTSAFWGDSWSVVFPSTDMLGYTNLVITAINNSDENLLSASIEWSPNDSNWETDWDRDSLLPLTASGAEPNVRSVQIAGNSRRYLRVRAIPSGAAGDFSGSLDVYINANLG